MTTPISRLRAAVVAPSRDQRTPLQRPMSTLPQEPFANQNVDLNVLRARVLGNQNAGTTRPNDPAKSIVVDRDGNMHMADTPNQPLGPKSTIPQETFAGENIDLNLVRARILGNQNAGTTRPTDPSKSLLVDRDGNLHMADAPDKPIAPQSTVPQETFAGRHEDDIAIARDFMPRNTQQFTSEQGITGFVYTFKTELGDEFTLFAYYDGSNYQVQVIEPEVEERFNSPHTGHIFPTTGLICFGSNYGSGMPTLRDAFAKSVLWANGMSIAHQTGQFPFSNNN